MRYNSCLLLLLIILVSYQICQIKEGFDIPDRYIDQDLQSYLYISDSHKLHINPEITKYRENQLSKYSKEYHHKNNFKAEIARSNSLYCKDSGDYSGCNTSTPSPEKIDLRYVSIPTNIPNLSNDYTYLSLCPNTYQNNMKLLSNKKSLGQYAGYTTNNYIDKIRYIDSSEPLPVNPDFFYKNGGTY